MKEGISFFSEREKGGYGDVGQFRKILKKKPKKDNPAGGFFVLYM